MSHLTDTQLVILSNAAQAEDGSILPLPDCRTSISVIPGHAFR